MKAIKVVSNVQIYAKFQIPDLLYDPVTDEVTVEYRTVQLETV